MSLVTELPGVVAVNPLRMQFRHIFQVIRHHEELNGPQGTTWQWAEWERARELARKNLSPLFDQFTAEDLAAIAWSDIADDVRRLTHLAENPE